LSTALGVLAHLDVSVCISLIFALDNIVDDY